MVEGQLYHLHPKPLTGHPPNSQTTKSTDLEINHIPSQEILLVAQQNKKSMPTARVQWSPKEQGHPLVPQGTIMCEESSSLSTGQDWHLMERLEATRVVDNFFSDVFCT